MPRRMESVVKSSVAFIPLNSGAGARAMLNSAALSDTLPAR